MTIYVAPMLDCNCVWCNGMREGGLEPPSLAAPDPKCGVPPIQEPKQWQEARTEPHQSAPIRTGHVTACVIPSFFQGGRL